MNLIILVVLVTLLLATGCFKFGAKLLGEFVAIVGLALTLILAACADMKNCLLPSIPSMASAAASCTALAQDRSPGVILACVAATLGTGAHIGLCEVAQHHILGDHTQAGDIYDAPSDAGAGK